MNKILRLIGLVTVRRVHLLEKNVKNLEALCERRLRACKSLERQKTTQYLHIQSLDKEIESIRNDLEFWRQEDEVE